jgi:hypothetical protein
MKKNILFLLCVALSLGVFVVQTNAQTKETKFVSGKPILGKAVTFNTTTVSYPKVAWSNFKDKNGNMYRVYAPKMQFSTPPFKIYKYTPEGEGFLYFNSLDNNISYENAPTGMKYTFDEEVNFYWQNGTRFFKLTSDGTIQLLAGEAKSNINKMLDGMNGTTTGGLRKFKYNPYDGFIYFTEAIYNRDGIYLNGKIIPVVTDMVFLRKLSKSGEITTCTYTNGALFLEKPYDIFFAPNGDIIYTKEATAFGSRAEDVFRWDGKNNPVSIVKFHGGLFTGVKGDRGRWTVGDTSIARVSAGVQDIIVNSKNELIIYDGNAKRFAKLSGSKVTAYSGTSNMQKVIEGISLGAESKETDGTATTAQFGYVGTLTIDKDDNIFFRSQYGVRKIASNGTVTTIIKSKQQKTGKNTGDEN